MQITPPINKLSISDLHSYLIGKYWSNYDLNKFKRNHWVLTNKISRSEDYEKVLAEFDIILVGSDQIWNSACIETMGLHYFGINANINKQKLIAYAPSFGKNRFETDKENIEKLQNLLQRYTAISVRENDGIELLKRFFHIDTAVRVLDPTMLMNKEYYLNLANKMDIKEKNTLAYYFLDDNREKQEYVSRLATLTGLTPKNIGKGNFLTSTSLLSKLKNLRHPSIESWIINIAESSMVVTDSFHGTVFSIIFNKEFVTFGNISRGNSRFDNLLSMFGLERRLIVPSSKCCKLFDKIDYDKVNEKIRYFQKLSQEFIDNSLK